MPVNSPKELFVRMLSDLRQGSERSTKILQEIGDAAQNPEVKAALEARAFVAEKTLATIDECFRLIGEKPVKASGRFYETFVEDFRREFAEIQLPVARHLFVLAKMSHLIHFRIGEYVALIAAADVTGHPAVGVLLESALADKLAFVERTKRMVRNIVQTKIAERVAA
ncbi:MAG: hypothetical protein DMG61_18095 [Acidobacteria bacterium]|nr:MAG: hypothetical protein DMG61_18095 [Acidobacteriota bacterium]PYY18847.1 MAG: hypothetical protein DMG60_06775 [Acidobacteriota bacterium]